MMLPAQSGQPISLQENIFRRIMLVMTMALIAAMATTAAIYIRANDAARNQQMREMNAHFTSRTIELDRAWQIQADIFRAQLEFNRLLENPDQRQSRMTAFLASFGGQQTFTHVKLLDLQRRVLYSYATRSQESLALPPPSPAGSGLAWVYGAADRTIYRSIEQPIWQGDGKRGWLILYTPLDNALLQTIVYPGASISLRRGGEIIANSIAPNRTRDAGAVESVTRWAGDADGPEVISAKTFVPPLPLVETLTVVAITSIVLIMLSQLVLGRWLRQLAARLQTLGDAARHFGRERLLTAPALQELNALAGREADEIGALISDFTVMMADINRANQELVASEERLRRLNDELEQRVQLRTQDLANTLRTLKDTQNELVQSEKLAALGSLVAGVAHELNTPIGNAVTIASTLRDKTATFARELQAGTLRRSTLNDMTETITRGSELVLRNLENAADLVANFKQVAVDQTSTQRRAFDLKVVIEEVLSTLHHLVRNKPIRVVTQLEAGIEMNSYPGPLGQVINNLFNNALIHGFAGRDRGEIKISTRRDGEHAAILEIEDDGNGIAAENIGRVFDPFFTTRLGQGGSGLGLNIVHNIVTRLLGGRIEVRNNGGGGVTFVLTIPLIAPAENSAVKSVSNQNETGN